MDNAALTAPGLRPSDDRADVSDGGDLEKRQVTDSELKLNSAEGDAETEDVEEAQEEEEDDDDEMDDEEAELISDDDDMFFEESNPHALHRSHSVREPMVPFQGCVDAEEALQHLVQVFEERYGPEHPYFYIGSLENAMKEVTDVEEPLKLKPLLIFIHNDNSITGHVFCKEVLCSQLIMEYVNTNYIIWPWDITHMNNKQKLMSMIEECFSDESLSDDKEEKETFKMHPPWFKQSHERERHEQQSSPKGQDGMTPRSIVEQLVSKVDDLPAFLVFYPIAGQPHSIQETWIASKGGKNMSDSFLTALVSSLDNYKFLLQQSEHSSEDKRRYDMLQQRHMRQMLHKREAVSSPSTSMLASLAGTGHGVRFQQLFGNVQNIEYVVKNEATGAGKDHPENQDSGQDRHEDPDIGQDCPEDWDIDDQDCHRDVGQNRPEGQGIHQKHPEDWDVDLSHSEDENIGTSVDPEPAQTKLDQEPDSKLTDDTTQEQDSPETAHLQDSNDK